MTKGISAFIISFLLALPLSSFAASTDSSNQDLLSNTFLQSYTPLTEQIFKSISEFEEAKRRSMISDDLKADPKFSAIKNRLSEVSSLYNIRAVAHTKLESYLSNKTTEVLLQLSEATDEFIQSYDVNRDMGPLLKTAESTLSDATGIETESLQAALKGSFEDSSSQQALQDIMQKYQTVALKNKPILVEVHKFEDATHSEDKKVTKQILNVFTNLLVSELSKLDRVKVIYESEADPGIVPDFTVTGRVLWFYSDTRSSFWTGNVEGHDLKAKGGVTLLNKSGNIVKSFESDEAKSRANTTEAENFRSPIEKIISDSVKNISQDIK